MEARAFAMALALSAAELSDRYNMGWAHLRQMAEQVSVERDLQDAQRLFDAMRKDFPDLSERTIKAMLTDAYFTNQRVADAWQSRYENKAGWARAVENIKAELAIETRSRIDLDATETRHAIAAAVTRGGGLSPRAPVMPDLSQLSDAEFAAFKKDNFGFDSRG